MKSRTEEQRDLSSSLPALRRLAWVSVAGLSVALCFGLAQKHKIESITLALMVSAAATAVGTLMGFIFGVPFAKDVDSAAKDSTTQISDKTAQSSPERISRYRPNTSLEQISDWLAKMLVGVGLIEIKAFPSFLRQVSHFLSLSLQASESAEAMFALLIVFFSVLGFLFGFLWARIHLRRWFTEADENFVRSIDEKLSRIERDALASALFTRLLEEAGDDDAYVADEKLLSSLESASHHQRLKIFEAAKAASEEFSSPVHSFKVAMAIRIFRALIAIDRESSNHRAHSELAYALGRSTPPDPAAALEEINTAIRIRDRLRVKGWKYYELRRARYLIDTDHQFQQGAPTSPDLAARIEADVAVAKGSVDTERWDRWVAEQDSLKRWLTLNHHRAA